MRFSFIESRRDVRPARVMCRTLSISARVLTRRLGQRLLCMACAARMPPRAGQPRAARRDPAGSCPERRLLWAAPRACRSQTPGPPSRPLPDRAADAAGRSAGLGGPAAPDKDNRQPSWLSHRSRQTAARLHRAGPRPDPARRPDLHPGRRRLALSGGHPRHAHPQDRRLARK